MSEGKVKYITLNDSRVISQAFLKFGADLISLADFDFSRFSVEQRKVIFGWARDRSPDKYGPTCETRLLSRRKVLVTLAGEISGTSIVLDGVPVILDDTPLAPGEYDFELSVFLDVPLKTLGDVPDHIKPLLQYGEIVRVVAVFCEKNKESYEPLKCYGPVYDGASDLGFFLADIDKMDAFIRKGCQSDIIDLQHAFCTTEIANELFDAGLLVLVWGMTPWQYYIYGLSDSADLDLVPSVKSPQLNGRYKIRADIRELSVVPGVELLDWPSCRARKWPKVNLLGVGESVELNVHVRSFSPIHGQHGPSLAMITLHRVDVEPVIEPLLMVDIESFEAVPGY